MAAANLNVRLSTIRLAESRSQRQITGADQFPTLTGDGSYTRERISQKGVIGVIGGGSGGSGSGSSAGGGTFGSNGGAASGTTGRNGAIPNSVAGGTKIPPFNLFQYGFDASWELDLWGRVRREVESADASLEASTDARRNSLLSVVAEVARDYVQLRGEQTQLTIARDNIVTEQESLKLSQERFHAGLTTDLDVANAAAQLQTTAAAGAAARTAGSRVDQLAELPAGRSARRPARRTDQTWHGAAGAAARARRRAVRARSKAPRYPPGRRRNCTPLPRTSAWPSPISTRK